MFHKVYLGSSRSSKSRPNARSFVLSVIVVESKSVAKLAPRRRFSIHARRKATLFFEAVLDDCSRSVFMA
jgi:hypothetical protein